MPRLCQAFIHSFILTQPSLKCQPFKRAEIVACSWPMALVPVRSFLLLARGWDSSVPPQLQAYSLGSLRLIALLSQFAANPPQPLSGTGPAGRPDCFPPQQCNRHPGYFSSVPLRAGPTTQPGSRGLAFCPPLRPPHPLCTIPVHHSALTLGPKLPFPSQCSPGTIFPGIFG